MEPVSATAITTIVSYLAGKAFDKAFDTTTEEFTKESISWLKSIFVKEDGKPKEVLEDLQSNPEDDLNQQSAALALKKGVQKEPQAEKWLQEILEGLKNKKANGEQISFIAQSKNINSGSIQAGGNVTIGDNNH